MNLILRLCRKTSRYSKLLKIYNSSPQVRFVSNKRRKFSPPVNRADMQKVSETPKPITDENVYKPSVAERVDACIELQLRAHNGTMSDEFWKDVDTCIVQEFPVRHVARFPMAVMLHCQRNSNFEMAKNLFSHLRKNKSSSVALMICYANICSSANHSQELLELVKEIPEEAFLAENVASQIIRALCLTEHWHLGLEIVSKNKLESGVNYVIEAAFRNDDLDTGISIAEESLAKGGSLSDEAWTNWISSAQTIKDFQVLFNNLQKYEIVLPFLSAQTLQESLPKLLPFKVETTKIDEVCGICGSRLERRGNNDREHAVLLSAVQALLTGVTTDLYVNSEPKEIQRFLRFIKCSKPYDRVVDVLNLTMGTPNLTELFRVVTQLVESKSKPLLIGRKHLEKNFLRTTPKHLLTQIQYFFSHDISEDDPFMLYAALWRGHDSCLITNDLLRNHFFRLGLDDPHLRKIFLRWTYHNQIHYDYRTHTLHGPRKISQLCQGNLENGWHIPHEPIVQNKYDVQGHWLCLRRKS